ncbi:hypothetical protein GLOTRDRAFT_94524 [Gloeophyllum trabeum ATCC 11539]|uniref:Uncharacterized protein n=1 Tax=Gloeophyllum trabeum (strain ATCC 11539 / FP-39264 / Madison 617) TaxID=670483 RepID=S7RN52_GLOTA|nr:uncharacterized protein GLOTRDRAFT_94524 [Gloeophyllum trabeum ATCC 11539]EPQ54174.1 hypothetical protein GLOTRDRAFT_94524 [Gloeophyllum trabeum ATCC 11539]
MYLEPFAVITVSIAIVAAAPPGPSSSDGGNYTRNVSNASPVRVATTLSTYTDTEYFETLLSTSPYLTVLPTTIVWTESPALPVSSGDATGSICSCPFTPASSATPSSSGAGGNNTVSSSTYTLTLSYQTTMASSPYKTVLPTTMIWTQMVALPTAVSSTSSSGVCSCSTTPSSSAPNTNVLNSSGVNNSSVFSTGTAYVTTSTDV